MNYENYQNGLLKEVRQVSLTPQTTMLKILTYDGVSNRETSLITKNMIMQG